MKSLLSIYLSFQLCSLLLAQNFTPLEIVKKADDVVNAPQDAHILSTMILIDKNGNEKIRKTEMYQKAGDKRLVRFLSPADQKGIGFLSLPGDVNYLYLPAFRKIRRIASHVKNQNFAGTDFSYDDMSLFRFADDFEPEMLEITDQYYILKLIPKQGVEKDYKWMKISIRKDNFYPVKMEYYDTGDNLWKVMERRKIEKVKDYWFSMEMEMKDLKKDHSTISKIEKVNLDIGLKDDLFTKRYLMRAR